MSILGFVFRLSCVPTKRCNRSYNIESFARKFDGLIQATVALQLLREESGIAHASQERKSILRFYMESTLDMDGGSHLVACLDGLDAGQFSALLEKLGSEERVHVAVILLGLSNRLTDLETIGSPDKTEMTNSLFPGRICRSYPGRFPENASELLFDGWRF